MGHVPRSGAGPRRPLVTVAIPTYNRADGYLRVALESALAQDYAPLEIIVSDNCSTDRTEELVTGHGDARVRYIRQAQALRPNDNFNFCLNQARGEYFLLLHDDDLIDPDFVASCMDALRTSGGPVGIVRTGARVIDADGRTVSELENHTVGCSFAELCLAWLDGKIGMLLCSSLFNTGRLRQVGGFNSKHQLFQDVLAELQLAARFGRVDVPEVKASFRKHAEQNTSAAKVGDWCEDSVLLLETMCALAPEAKDVIRRRGRRKFAVHNYGLAKRIPETFARYRMFLQIYQSFGYAYSPMRFAAHTAKEELLARLQRNFPPSSARAH